MVIEEDGDCLLGLNVGESSKVEDDLDFLREMTQRFVRLPMGDFWTYSRRYTRIESLSIIASGVSTALMFRYACLCVHVIAACGLKSDL